MVLDLFRRPWRRDRPSKSSDSTAAAKKPKSLSSLLSQSHRSESQAKTERFSMGPGVASTVVPPFFSSASSATPRRPKTSKIQRTRAYSEPRLWTSPSPGVPQRFLEPQYERVWSPSPGHWEPRSRLPRQPSPRQPSPWPIRQSTYSPVPPCPTNHPSGGWKPNCSCGYLHPPRPAIYPDRPGPQRPMSMHPQDLQWTPDSSPRPNYRPVSHKSQPSTTMFVPPVGSGPSRPTSARPVTVHAPEAAYQPLHPLYHACLNSSLTSVVPRPSLERPPYDTRRNSSLTNIAQSLPPECSRLYDRRVNMSTSRIMPPGHSSLTDYAGSRSPSPRAPILSPASTRSPSPRYVGPGPPRTPVDARQRRPSFSEGQRCPRNSFYDDASPPPRPQTSFIGTPPIVTTPSPGAVPHLPPGAQPPSIKYTHPRGRQSAPPGTRPHSAHPIILDSLPNTPPHADGNGTHALSKSPPTTSRRANSNSRLPRGDLTSSTPRQPNGHATPHGALIASLSPGVPRSSFTPQAPALAPLNGRAQQDTRLKTDQRRFNISPYAPPVPPTALALRHRDDDAGRVLLPLPDYPPEYNPFWAMDADPGWPLKSVAL